MWLHFIKVDQNEGICNICAEDEAAKGMIANLPQTSGIKNLLKPSCQSLCI